MNIDERVLLLAPDLRRSFPRSPHEKLGGFVIAARVVDKARAHLAQRNGEYNFHPCGLAAFLWEFTGIAPREFLDYVATGANDDEVAQWLKEHSVAKDPMQIIKWNNGLKDKRISELPEHYQQYFENYVPKFCPQPNKVRFFFDVYDAEEGRLS